MFRTIQLSSRVSVQGRFVEDLENGDVVINDGSRNWRGRPIANAESLKEMPGAIAQGFEAQGAIGGAA